MLLILFAKLFSGCGFGLSLSPGLWLSFKIIIEGVHLSMNINEARKRRNKKPFNSISYTTGDIGLNVDFFNSRFGTADLGSESGESSSEGSSTGLCEAKRYVRRYYIRPMNIFCSNKAEIIKALIDIGDQNCSVYTLNNLEGDKDTNKLTTNDIIYYYDDGILYDKNKVKVMDYDLSIKKEEDRKKFANVDKAPEKEFSAEYEDRMTDATQLEENFDDELLDTCPYEVIGADYNRVGDKFIISLNHNVSDVSDAAAKLSGWLEKTYNLHVVDWNTNGSNVFIFELAPDNAFNLDFEDVNVYGEKLTEEKENHCCICGEEIDGYGHNPEPYKSADEGRCCSACNLKFVITKRLEYSRGE